VPRDDARRELGLPAEGRVLGVFGALAGARALNELAVSAFGEAGPAVLHVSGERDYESLRARVARADYVLVPALERFGLALGAVDLALSRAGGTVWELAAAGLPAVLVPYPHATGDHQYENARWFADGAVVVRESELASVPAIVRELLADPPRLARMREAMLAKARPDAADEIAEELLELAAARR
jgi:UDP-N-acetylglucosamine--N-acetylmuramyl-(pentapeptide) pyrophosphoryl-undecaprenol N-acetylglucosamine transferase